MVVLGDSSAYRTRRREFCHETVRGLSALTGVSVQRMTDPDVDAPRVRKSPPGTNSDRRDAPVAKDDVSVAKGDTGALVAHEPFTLHRLLVESVRDYAIFALDPKGHVVSWNIGAQRIKGYSADEIIGSHFSVFYPHHEVERGKPDWELEVASDVGRFEDEGWRVRKDGTQF